MEYLVRNKHSVRRHISETWFIVIGNYRLQEMEGTRGVFARSKSSSRRRRLSLSASR